MSNSVPADYIPVIIQLIVALGFVGVTMLLTHLVGRARKTKHKLDAFECGIEAQGDARTRFSVKYFLVATLFVLFDVEVIFMYPWAVNFKEFVKEGMDGFLQMLLFMGTLMVGFFYIIRKKVLDWE